MSNTICGNNTICSDALLVGNMPSQVSVDVASLTGWESLSSGYHNITVKAKAAGYADSEPSAAVSVTKAPQEYTDCITFTGESSDFTLAVGSEEPKEWDGTVEYSTDHNTWTVWDGSEISSSSKKLYLRGSGNTTFYMLDGAHFVLSARAACSGNIQTLLEYSNPPAAVASNCYYGMFDGCKNLTQAPALPATTLAPYCYKYMFDGCTNLLTAPALPATTLANSCYNYMFHGCTSLTTAPALPATTLANYCYGYMFQGCTKLKVNASSGNKIFTCPSSIPSMAVTNMFTNTGGTFKGSPTSGNTYYWTE